MDHGFFGGGIYQNESVCASNVLSSLLCYVISICQVVSLYTE